MRTKINAAFKTVILLSKIYVRKRNIRFQGHAVRMADGKELKIPPRIWADVWLSRCLR
jgi:hypothetical protein